MIPDWCLAAGGVVVLSYLIFNRPAPRVRWWDNWRDKR